MAERKHKLVDVELLPCPCCGGKDLDVGIQACMTYGVKCRGCRLRVERESGEWPKGVYRRKDSYEANMERLFVYLLNIAVAAWNTRPAVPAAKMLKVKAGIVV